MVKVLLSMRRTDNALISLCEPYAGKERTRQLGLKPNAALNFDCKPAFPGSMQRRSNQRDMVSLTTERCPASPGPKKGVWNFQALKTPAFIRAGDSRHLFLGKAGIRPEEGALGYGVCAFFR